MPGELELGVVLALDCTSHTLASASLIAAASRGAARLLICRPGRLHLAPQRASLSDSCQCTSLCSFAACFCNRESTCTSRKHRLRVRSQTLKFSVSDQGKRRHWKTIQRQFKENQSRPFRGPIERARPRVFFSSLALASDSRRGFSSGSCHLLKLHFFFCSCESFWRGLGRFWCQKYNPIQPKRPILATLTCNPAHDFHLRTENSRQPCRARLEPARNLLGIGILQVNTDRPPESGIVARKITRYAEPPKHCPRRLPEADVQPRHCGLVLGRRQGRGYRRIPPWTNGGVRGVEV